MLKKLFSFLVLSLLFIVPAAAIPVKMETSAGTVRLELDEKNAPETVANFLQYVDDGYYNGTIFHRVIKGFMIQGGGFTTELRRKPTREPITNEADNGLKNKRGTIAMARTQVIDSATSQFFINHTDNPFLDHKNKTARGYGYAVFGRVTDGMDVVDDIAATPVKKGAGPFANLPVKTIEIISIERTDE